jgi:hypothetical protein
MRFVHHLAVKLPRTSATCLRKGFHNALCMRHFMCFRCKAFMDGQHLVWVDCKLTGEACFAGPENIFVQAISIAKINSLWMQW